MADHETPPVIQLVGYSDTGKTTLISRLITCLSQEGWKVGAIKRHTGEVEMDQRGTDSWRHREAGADRVAIAAFNQTALILPRPLDLRELLPLYRGVELVLVEGFKGAPYPKLVMVKKRDELSLIRKLSNVQGVIAPFPVKEVSLPVYRREDVEGVLKAVKVMFGLRLS